MEAALVDGKRTRASTLAAAPQGGPERVVRCLCCGAPAYHGGRAPSGRGTYFAHAPAKPGERDPADRCPLHSKNERRFAWLKEARRDTVEGERFRTSYLQDAPLRRSFAFCLRAMNAKPPMSAEVFAGLIMVADGLDLWSLPGQTHATLSMMLLTLEDVRSTTGDQREIWYRYELQKPRGLKDVCLAPGECLISKHFVNRDGSTGQLLTRGQNNVIHLTQEEFDRLGGKSDWVSPGTLIAIRRRADHQIPPGAAAAPATSRPKPTPRELL